MQVTEDLVGRKVLVQTSERHWPPEVWLVREIRECYFGRFIAFQTATNDTVVSKLETLYTVKFI